MDVLELARLHLGSMFPYYHQFRREKECYCDGAPRPPEGDSVSASTCAGGGCSSANRLHVGAAVAAALKRLPTAEGEEPQELPARSADLGQGQLPGPPGAESKGGQEQSQLARLGSARLSLETLAYSHLAGEMGHFLDGGRVLRGRQTETRLCGRTRRRQGGTAQIKERRRWRNRPDQRKKEAVAGLTDRIPAICV